MNTFEQPPEEENMETLKDRVVEDLRENPENLESLHEWLDMREGECKTSEDTLKLNIEIAGVYEDAGLMERA